LKIIKINVDIYPHGYIIIDMETSLENRIGQEHTLLARGEQNGHGPILGFVQKSPVFWDGTGDEPVPTRWYRVRITGEAGRAGWRATIMFRVDPSSGLPWEVAERRGALVREYELLVRGAKAADEKRAIRAMAEADGISWLEIR
jgi:hypothetical protein